MQSFSVQSYKRGLLPFLALSLSVVLSACGGGSDPVAPATNIANAANGNNGANTCTKVSTKVGQVTTLTTRSHGVTGKARVVDDCTIEITGFNYDGGGLPDVFVYGAKGGRYSSGFAIGPNLFGKVQTNATVTVTLKAGEIDNLDGISIWCVRAGVSFGDGVFAAP